MIIALPAQSKGRIPAPQGNDQAPESLRGASGAYHQEILTTYSTLHENKKHFHNRTSTTVDGMFRQSRNP